MSTSTSKRSLVCDDDPPSLAVRSGRNSRRATRNSVAVGLGADAAHFAGRARRLPQHENGTTAADLGIALRELKRVCTPGGSIVAGLFGPPEAISYKPVLDALGPFMPRPPPGAKPGGPFRLSAPGVLVQGFTSAGIEVSGTGEANCPFEYESWDHFWRGTRAAGPTQMAIGRAGLDAVEEATRNAVEPLTAEDGSISFDTNLFIYVFGQA